MDLRLHEVSRKAWIFRATGKGTMGRSFIYDIKKLPTKTEPQNIIVERKVNPYSQHFTMEWKKFLGEIAIGDVICIDWTHFKKSVT